MRPAPPALLVVAHRRAQVAGVAQARRVLLDTRFLDLLPDALGLVLGPLQVVLRREVGARVGDLGLPAGQPPGTLVGCHVAVLLSLDRATTRGDPDGTLRAPDRS